jgi:hypothetical protein
MACTIHIHITVSSIFSPFLVIILQKIYYGNIIAYSYESGYVTGYDESSYNFTYEMEINNGKCRKKLYHNSYSSWSEWKDIYFSSDGNHLFIGDSWFDRK